MMGVMSLLCASFPPSLSLSIPAFTHSFLIPYSFLVELSHSFITRILSFVPHSNSSIGGPAGWTEYVVGVLASRIADAGRVVTIAAGNEGADGAWYASGPATGVDVISVSSVEK